MLGGFTLIGRGLCKSSQVPESGEHRLQLFGVHADCSILIDQLERQHEAHTAAPLHKRSLNALHDAPLDSHRFPNHEFVKWLDPLSERIGP